MSDFPFWTLRLSDFRVLREVEWCPFGVCLIAGPNGSGKTTLLMAFEFLSRLFDRDLESALRRINPAYLRRVGVAEQVPVHLEIECGSVTWKLDLPVDPRGLRSSFGEQLLHDGVVKLRADMFKQEWHLGSEVRTLDDRRCCARVLWDEQRPEWLRPLVSLLEGYRFHGTYWLNRVKEPGRHGDASAWLFPTGQNLWAVLHEWKGSPRRYDDRFEWVMKVMREAFPSVISDLEFEGMAGHPHGLVYPPGASGPEEAIPGFLAADGVLTGLLHLTAVAGARKGSVIAFDEMENQLHPHAIRAILAAMRQRSEDENLTIALTTHSPVVMNEFKGRENQFFILENQQDRPNPVPLDQARDPAFLSHFALGDLYEREKFAAPTPQDN